MPYGELGPLDIQLTKVDKFDQMQSGLTIQEALNTLEDRAKASFFEMVTGYIAANQGTLSFASASKAASDFVTQLYAPVFARIDPDDVGWRARSMRIADDYGKRLALKWQNVKPDTVRKLAETYSSHSFVIDMREAEGLFHRVRAATDAERAMVETLGLHARFQVPGSECAFHTLTEHLPNEGEPDERDHEVRGEPSDGRNPAGTVDAPNPPADPTASADGLAVRGRRRTNGQEVRE